MWAAGFSVNNLTLMALAVSVGFVVDDAIVMIENMFRNLQRGSSPIRASLEGARQIAFTFISIGVSLVSNVLAHREQFHQSRLVENVVPSSPQYQETVRQVTKYFLAQGSSLVEAQQQATGWIGQQLAKQASFLAYMDAFWVLMLISLAAVPLALSLRRSKLGGGPQMAH